MFQNFPYTDMHQLNLDWIIKIAKDFLDQYTHIQDLISQGEESIQNLTNESLESLESTTQESLESLNETAQELQTALQTWFDEHENIIPEQLADATARLATATNQAILTFNNEAAAKAAETIQSIPADYTTLANEVQALVYAYDVGYVPITLSLPNAGHIAAATGAIVTPSGYNYSDMIAVTPGDRMYVKAGGSPNVLILACYATSTDATANVSKSLAGIGGIYDGEFIIPTGINYVRVCNNSDIIATPILGTYMDFTYIVDQHDEVLKTGSFQIDTTWDEGYIKSADGVEAVSNSYQRSAFIPVKPGDRYRIITLVSPSVFAIAYYTTASGNANTSKSIAGNNLGCIYDITIPSDIFYMRVCKSIESAPECEITYGSIDIYNTNKNVNDFASIAITKRKAAISFVFDDGNANDETIKGIFDNHGKKCGFAIMTYPPTRYAKYFTEGFELLAHANSMPGTVDETSVRNMLKTAYNTIYSMVGVCYGWVTPSSAMPDEYKELVYDYYQYGYTVYKGNIATPSAAAMDKTLKTYGMWRSSMSSLTEAQLKDIIDYAVSHNETVCFYAHGADLDASGDLFTSTTLNNILTYCDTVGIQVMTPHDAAINLFTNRHNED